MASISAGEVYSVAKFAFDLFKACKACKGEFDQIGKEVFAMRTIIELVHIDCENPQSILNVTDDVKKSNRKALSIHIGNCKGSLEEVDACLKRYRKMTAIDKLAWAFSGRDEIKSLESNLSSLATQLSGFTSGLAMKGMGAVYQEQRKLHNAIERVETALDQADGNSKVAVEATMGGLDQSSMTPLSTKRYKKALSDYAEEVSRSTSFVPPSMPSRARTPDIRGRKGSGAILDAPNNDRSQSADTKLGQKSKDLPRSQNKAAKKSKSGLLECWLVQIKSGNVSLLTWEFLDKEIQPRGQ